MPLCNPRLKPEAGRAPLGGLLLVTAATLALGCSTVRYEVGYRTVPAAPSGHFMAGAADVDLTPPPGLPLFGYSLPAEKHARGYQGRLRARALVLQDRRGQRLGLVQVDLGAMSALVHRRVAEQTAKLGIGPDRLLIAATHTHAGPGGFFGTSFYNYMGSPRPGFDPQVLDFLVERITGSVQQAVQGLVPAAVGSASAAVQGVSMVRSLGELPGSTADDRVRVLRVDAVEAAGHRPLAAFAVFAVHGTCVSADAPVYHGDLFASASRELSRLTTPATQQTPVVAAIANGMEGDVAPLRTAGEAQGFELARRRGLDLARGGASAFAQAGQRLRTDIELRHGYWERAIDDPSAEPDARPCTTPVVGVATLGGSEDGRSPLYGKFGVYEGHRRSRPRGCQGYKLPAFGALGAAMFGGVHRWNPRMQGAHRLLELPRVLPFQIMRVGDFVIATVPGEPTGRVGRAARAVIATELGLPDPDRIAVVGLANEYIGYFTMGPEYAHQHYEGASTFYGPHQGDFSRESLQRIARAMAARGARAVSAYPIRKFTTGPEASLWPDAREPLPQSRWRIVGASAQASRATLRWEGRAPGQRPADPPAKVVVQCRDAAGAMVDLDDDDGTDMRVEVDLRGPGTHWTAHFEPSERTLPAGERRSCRFGVLRTTAEPLWSQPFEIAR